MQLVAVTHFEHCDVMVTDVSRDKTVNRLERAGWTIIQISQDPWRKDWCFIARKIIEVVTYRRVRHIYRRASA